MKTLLITSLVISVSANEHLRGVPAITDMPKCNNTINCGHGKCVEYYCQCDKKWISVNTLCDYKQKEQITAVLLSFLTTPFGGARFYICDYIGGGIQLSLILSTCLAPFIYKENGANWQAIALVTLAVWMIIDMVLFGMNSLNDQCGGNVPLYKNI